MNNAQQGAKASDLKVRLINEQRTSSSLAKGSSALSSDSSWKPSSSDSSSTSDTTVDGRDTPRRLHSRQGGGRHNQNTQSSSQALRHGQRWPLGMTRYSPAQPSVVLTVHAAGGVVLIRGAGARAGSTAAIRVAATTRPRGTHLCTTCHTLCGVCCKSDTHMVPFHSWMGGF